MKKLKDGWLAMEIHSNPAKGRNKCKEAFLTNLDEIRIALKTCSIHDIWMMLKNKNIYPGNYSGFWRSVRKYSQELSSPQDIASVEQDMAMAKEIHLSPTNATPLGNRPAVPQRETARTPQFRQSKTPINSNGDPIR